MTETHNTPGEQDVAGVIMLPPFIFLIALAVAVLMEFVVPVGFLPAPGLANWLSLVGAVLMIAGIALAVWGQRTFAAAGTNIRPDQPALKLVTHGPYRFTRNPMYVGLLSMLAGIILAVSLEWGLLVWPLFALVMHFGVIVREERYLTHKFGTPYEEFLERTRRYL